VTSYFDKNILSIYISRKILFYFFAIFTSLSLIILINHIFLVLKESISVGYLSGELYTLILNKYLRDVSLVLGLSLFLGCVVAFNNLAKNSELIILNSSGMNFFSVFSIISPLILFFVLMSIVITFYVQPNANLNINKLLEAASNRPNFLNFKQKQFVIFKDKNISIFVDRVDNNGENQILKKIYIWSEKNKKLTIAKSGEKYIDSSKKIFINLFDGRIYDIEAPKVGITKFKKMNLLLYDPSRKKPNFSNLDYDSMSVFILLEHLPKKEALAELLHKISFPLSNIILIFLSIVLTLKNTSKSNFSLIYAVITYTIFYNLIYISKATIENNDFNPAMFFLPYLILILIIYIKILSLKIKY